MSLVFLQLGHTCGEHCWSAAEVECKCSCGGKNHGILKRGGEKPQRTRKVAGQFYELLEIGTHRSIETRRMELILACGHHWLFDPYGPYIAKPLTDAQRKWPEVAGVQEASYILWANPSLIQKKA